ncbi:MAG: HD domain-containing protein, partial [Candidatus Aminicenantes bacterium]|nr:HD domain-containing protein [Candidatus Aminicenantes bacterium]
KSTEFALVLISQSPVEENFIKLIHSLKANNPLLGIILLSEIQNKDYAISLLEEGTIDHITTPSNITGIFSAIKNEFHKRELIQKNEFFQKKLRKLRHEQERGLKKALGLEEIYNTTLENLMTALDLRDVETFGHSRTVAKYSQVLAQILGIKDKVHLDHIRKGALLHDVGKIAIPDSILKKPSSLSSNEWEKIKLHPALGFGLIKEIKLVKEVGDIILYHHEKFDGTGYPYCLKKENIPVEARIFAIADTLDAITSKRPYRGKRDFKYAKEEIQQHSGTQFDPEIVDAFCSLNMEKWAKIRFQTTKLMPHFEEMLQLSK